MKLTIITVTDRTPPWVHDAYQDYWRRLPPVLKPHLIEIPSTQHTEKRNTVNKSADEGKRLLQALPKNAYRVVLDEQGRSWNSIQFSQRFSHWLELGKPIAFLIGGAYGHATEVSAQADEKCALSTLTFPHNLVKVILIEQLYRAWTLHTNHPYHKV